MDKYTELLQKLANKFGTTVEHLWGVLVRQAYIDSMTSIGLYLACIITCVGGIYFSLKKLKDGHNEDVYTLSLLLGIIALLIIALFCSQINMIIAGIVNPEYWALMEIKNFN